MNNPHQSPTGIQHPQVSQHWAKLSSNPMHCQIVIPRYPASTSQIQSNAATGDVEGFDTGTGGTSGGAGWPKQVAADGPKKEHRMSPSAWNQHCHVMSHRCLLSNTQKSSTHLMYWKTTREIASSLQVPSAFRLKSYLCLPPWRLPCVDTN